MSKINIVSWNVNGIRAVEKKKSLEWLRDSSYDILCFQETKVFDISILSDNLLNFDSYDAYWQCATEKKGYSGVVVYTKIKPNKVITNFGDNLLSKEGRVIQLEFDDFILLNVYFPNGGSGEERLQYKMKFYDDFFRHIKKLDKAGKKIVFCGDVNTAHQEMDLARPKQNEKVSGFLPEERVWLDDLVTAKWHDTFRMYNNEGGNYTWWDMKTRARDRNVGWRIDYFFVNNSFKNNIEDAYILADVFGSDHCPLAITIKF